MQTVVAHFGMEKREEGPEMTVPGSQTPSSADCSCSRRRPWQIFKRRRQRHSGLVRYAAVGLLWLVSTEENMGKNTFMLVEARIRGGAGGMGDGGAASSSSMIEEELPRSPLSTTSITSTGETEGDNDTAQSRACGKGGTDDSSDDGTSSDTIIARRSPESALSDLYPSSEVASQLWNSMLETDDDHHDEQKEDITGLRISVLNEMNKTHLLTPSSSSTEVTSSSKSMLRKGASRITGVAGGLGDGYLSDVYTDDNIDTKPLLPSSTPIRTVENSQDDML